MKDNIFLMSEELVNLIVDESCKFYDNTTPLEGCVHPMELLRAICDYCLYGQLRDEYLEDEGLMMIMNLIREKLLHYISTLRRAGIVPPHFKE